MALDGIAVALKGRDSLARKRQHTLGMLGAPPGTRQTAALLPARLTSSALGLGGAFMCVGQAGAGARWSQLGRVRDGPMAGRLSRGQRPPGHR
jgi:hypothetical protein